MAETPPHCDDPPRGAAPQAGAALPGTRPWHGRPGAQGPAAGVLPAGPGWPPAGAVRHAGAVPCLSCARLPRDSALLRRIRPEGFPA